MVRIHSGVPHKPQKTQEIRDEARSAEAEICIHLYPIQKKSETGGILDAEEKRHFRTFARNLCAALAAHRIRVSFRTAIERYTPAEVDESWYWLAESLERVAIAKLEELYRVEGGPPGKRVQ